MTSSKKWVICFGVMGNPITMGRVEDEDRLCVVVRSSEAQLYGLQAWGKKFIKRFTSPKIMIYEYAKTTGHSTETIRGWLLASFPSFRDEIEGE